MENEMNGQTGEECSPEEMAEKIIEAEEIKQDPEKMKLVAPILASKKQAVNALTGLDALKAKVAKAAPAQMDTEEE